MCRIMEQNVMNEISAQLPKSLQTLTKVDGESLRISAPHDVDAWYELTASDHGCSLALLTLDRWLSESIEGDLEHSGDELEELFEEELVELNWEGDVPPMRHYRNDKREYVFSCLWPSSSASEVSIALQAMIAMFTELGEMGGEDQED